MGEAARRARIRESRYHPWHDLLKSMPLTRHGAITIVDLVCYETLNEIFQPILLDSSV